MRAKLVRKANGLVRAKVVRSRKKAKFEEIHQHAKESRWSAWSYDDNHDVRQFMILVQSPMPSDRSLRSGLLEVVDEMWLGISGVDVVSSYNVVFAKFAGRTEQLLRLRTTLLPDGTRVTFFVRERKDSHARKRDTASHGDLSATC